jgi:hypothetical protein
VGLQKQVTTPFVVACFFIFLAEIGELSGGKKTQVEINVKTPQQ